MKILIVVDVQNDFMHTNGALYVEGAETIRCNINRLLNSSKFDLKVITQDWHPPNHMSFANSYTNTAPFTEREVSNGVDKLKQMMWPDHCIRNTWGAEICPEISAHTADMIIRKGTHVLRENYSFLSYTNLVSTEYHSMFAPLDAEYFVCGIATDHCIKATALDLARRLNKEVTIIIDAVKGVDNYKANEWLLNGWQCSRQWVKNTEEVIC